jgi:DNA-binding transcriptional MerR regulator
LEVRAVMLIRELAERTGTTTRTLRYYEEQGLLPAGRSANGYRAYGEQHVRLVREIRILQSIGFSLEEARPFVECLLAGNEEGDDCPASVEVYRRKLAYLDQHISRMREIRDRLAGRLAEITPSEPMASLNFACRPFLDGPYDLDDKLLEEKL